MNTKDANKPMNSLNGVIIAVDINGFAQDDRSDIDRKVLRDVLNNVLMVALRDSGIKKKVIQAKDTGDGLLCLPPQDASKKNIVTHFIPSLIKSLTQHNSTAPSNQKIKLRVVLHSGEYIKDQNVLAGKGYVGHELNMAFRLLDSDILRIAITKTTNNKPVRILVSENFYKSIIIQQLPNQKHRFKKCKAKTKDRELEAWAMDFDPTTKKAIKSVHEKEKITYKKISSVRRRQKTGITLSELNGRCIYITTFDIHNLLLYRRIAEEIPLRAHLETAILLGDKVFMHCADPYRSSEIYDLLYEYIHFIDNGTILFLLASSIKDVKSDYKKYLTNREHLYNKSPYGHTDYKFLRSPVTNPSDIESVSNLIMRSPFALRRGFSGSEQFKIAIEKDLNQSEEFMIKSPWGNSKISKNLNLTLYQLLHLVELNNGRQERRVYADTEEAASLIQMTNQKLQSNKLSRNELLTLFSQRLKLEDNGDSTCLDKIQSRINLLHAHANIGKHTLMELHPNRDKSSFYYYKLLFDHLGYLSNGGEVNSLGVEKLKKLKDLNCWNEFRNYHLSILADIHTRRLGDLDYQTVEYFKNSIKNKQFKKITEVLKHKYAKK